LKALETVRTPFAKEQAMNTIQTILHATDFSESAEHAFRLACSLARDHAAELVVLHVATPHYPIVGELVVVPPIPMDTLDEDERKEIMSKLEAMKPKFGGFPIKYRLECGEPVDRILDVADEVDAGLIVVGTHGRTGLKRMLMGSVAEHLVRKAPCSVLTVKSPTAERLASAERELAGQRA
jgi:universal stress protein A